jgi:peptidoglycan/xylan/chitin deacetylase (PgdA/CDA1 family)
VTHPDLSRLAAAGQRAEIEQSKAACEALSRRPAMGFAYPHGARSAETARLVRAAGFACACASDVDLAFDSADRFVLPRVAVGDWDGEAFTRRLARAFL